MKTPKQYDVHVNGVRLNIAEWESDGPPLILIHGLTANCRCWDSLAANLHPKYRLIAPDLRGRGASEHPETGYHIDIHADDILALIREMNLTPEKSSPAPVLVGHSMGAMIALSAAAKGKGLISKIILMDAGGKNDVEDAKDIFKSILPALERLGKTYPDFDAYMEAVKGIFPGKTFTPELSAYFEHDAKTGPQGVSSSVKPGTIEEETANLMTIDLGAYYPLIDVPVLIMRAMKGIIREDAVFIPNKTLNRMLKALPTAKHIDIAADHYTILFDPLPDRDKAVMDFA